MVYPPAPFSSEQLTVYTFTVCTYTSRCSVTPFSIWFLWGNHGRSLHSKHGSFLLHATSEVKLPEFCCAPCELDDVRGSKASEQWARCLSVVGNKCHALHISTICPRKGCVPGSHVLLLILLSAIIRFCLNLIVHALIGGEWKSDGICSLFNTPGQQGDFIMSQFLRLWLIWFNMSKDNLLNFHHELVFSF